MKTFQELNIKPEIVRALAEMGIKEPTTIQEQSIPFIKAGKDLIGISKTGSGKTAAFSVPLLERIEPHNGIQILVMAPTRELAVQIAQEMRKFGKYTQFMVSTIYGGVSINPQIEELRKTDIVVGTPGRLLDHLQRGTLDLKRLKSVVLDEADKMVEMGFIEDITEILNSTPNNRQILLFGATLSQEINALKQSYMTDPEEVRTESQVGQDLLKQYYYDVPSRDKFSLLIHLLKTEQVGQAMIFCSARSTVELVHENLKTQGVRNGMIHGKMSQNKRLNQIKYFNEGKPNIIVASPVAARGLDIKDVTHIFNYDISKDPQEYIHRIGRTARAGESGKAITLLCERDYDSFSDILHRFPVKVEKMEPGDFERVRFETRMRPSSGFKRFGNRENGPRSNGPSHGFGQNRFGSGRNMQGPKSYGNPYQGRYNM